MRQKQRVFSLFLLSPSSRRAWIEIFKAYHLNAGHKVALLAEGVDRNAMMASVMVRSRLGRPPRGGRG